MKIVLTLIRVKILFKNFDAFRKIKITGMAKWFETALIYPLSPGVNNHDGRGMALLYRETSGLLKILVLVVTYDSRELSVRNNVNSHEYHDDSEKILIWTHVVYDPVGKNSDYGFRSTDGHWLEAYRQP